MIFTIQIILTVIFLPVIPIAIRFWLKKLSMRTIWSRHVVITGGSTGIGLAIAKQCAQRGAHVTIISRDVDKLKVAVEEIKRHRFNEKQRIQFRAIDLSKSDDAVKTLFTDIERDNGSIYWLVNCAGGMMHGRKCEMYPHDPVHLMNIKYYAVYYPTRFILDKLNANGVDGIITITGSQAKELVMEIYGHGPHGECKLSSLGLAKVINMKPHSKISITLALEGNIVDGHGMNYVVKNYGLDKVKILSDRANLIRMEEAAKQIVLDSLSGKFISTSGLESWLILMFWRIGNFIRSAIVTIHTFYQKRFIDARKKNTKPPTIPSELKPSLEVESSSVKSDEIETNLMEMNDSNEKPKNVQTQEASSKVVDDEIPQSSDAMSSKSTKLSEDNTTVSSSETMQNDLDSDKIAEERFAHIRHELNIMKEESSAEPAICTHVNPTLTVYSTHTKKSQLNSNTDQTAPNITEKEHVNVWLNRVPDATKISNIPANVNRVSSLINTFDSASTADPEHHKSSKTSADIAISLLVPSKHPKIEHGTNELLNQNNPSSLFSNQISSLGSTELPLTNNLFSLFGSNEDSISDNNDFDSNGITTPVITETQENASKIGVIGMEMSAKSHAENRMPAFSFKTATDNMIDDVSKTGNSVDAGVTFSFNSNDADVDASKPFTFEAQIVDIEDLSNKPDTTGGKSQLPVRKSTRRFK